MEAKGSACLHAALKAKTPVSLDSVSTFADGVAVKRIGEESFRLCQANLDAVICVSNDEICAAIQDIFEDTRAISEPSGALSLAGMKKYIQQQQIKNKQLACILSGANTNFHSLRYISERAEIGEKREGLLAVTIPEQKGAFLAFCTFIGERSITAFNYRYSSGTEANIFVGIGLQKGQKELDAIIAKLQHAKYKVHDLSDDDMAKEHVRYMIGGRADTPLEERLYSFKFPECAGALLQFLSTIGKHWNITLFNYRNHGAEYGRVLCGFELNKNKTNAFNEHLAELGYAWKDESDNPSYQFFLAK